MLKKLLKSGEQTLIRNKTHHQREASREILNKVETSFQAIKEKIASTSNLSQELSDKIKEAKTELQKIFSTINSLVGQISEVPHKCSSFDRASQESDRLLGQMKDEETKFNSQCEQINKLLQEFTAVPEVVGVSSSVTGVSGSEVSLSSAVILLPAPPVVLSAFQQKVARDKNKSTLQELSLNIIESSVELMRHCPAYVRVIKSIDESEDTPIKEILAQISAVSLSSSNTEVEKCFDGVLISITKFNEFFRSIQNLDAAAVEEIKLDLIKELKSAANIVVPTVSARPAI